MSIKDLINQLGLYSQTQFTGQLTLNLQTTRSPHWDLYFHQGRLVAGTSTVHPNRRWRRQFSHFCPNLATAPVINRFDPHQPWDYQPLMQWVRQDKLSLPQITAMVEGAIVEILFDLIQATHKHRHDSLLQLTQRTLCPQKFNSELIAVRPALVYQQAIHTWRGWSQAGLAPYSANCAPMIWDAAELRRQTSFFVYCNLMSLMSGHLTLRDLAVKLKQDPTALSRSILPYIDQDIMGLVEVKDWLDWRSPTGFPNARATSTAPPVQPLAARAARPMVVYVEDSRFDCLAMGQILRQADCRFAPIQDSLQALPILIEHKPDLIFLDLHMPVMNGYELCGHIRRTAVFQETPVIIVTGSDALVDWVRAKLIGATDFIAKPIESEKVLTMLQRRLTHACEIAPSATKD